MKNQTRPHGPFASRITGAITISIITATCAAGALAAQQPGTAEGPVAPVGGHGLSAFIGGYDANRDGVVTRAEYDTVRKQRFAAADIDRDGSLSEEEYVAEFEGRLKLQYAGRAQDESYARSIRQAHVRFNILDTDHDGKLTADEESAIADKTFKRTDTNGDGKVDKTDADQ